MLDTRDIVVSTVDTASALMEFLFNLLVDKDIKES